MNPYLSRKINLFSIVFSIVVVAGHLIDVPSQDIFATRLILRYTSNLVAVAMGYFLFVSGYLFFRNFEMSRLTGKWKTRAKSLLIPFLLWNAIGYVVMWKVDLLDGRKVWECFFSIKRLADGPLWYVLCIMVYIVLSPAIYFIIQKKVAFWTLWTISIIGNLCFNLDQGNLYFYAFPFFLLGAGTALHYKDKFEQFAQKDKPEEKYKWGKAVLLFAIITLLLLIFFYDVYADYHKYSHFLNRLLAPVIMFGCFRKCEIKADHPVWKSSFFVYCGHEILIAFCMDRYIVREFLYHFEWMYLSIAGFTCFTIGVAGSLIVLYLIMHRFCPKVCALFSGGR